MKDVHKINGLKLKCFPSANKQTKEFWTQLFQNILLTLFYFANRNKIILQKNKFTMVKMISPLALIVNYVFSLLNNGLQPFVAVFNKSLTRLLTNPSWFLLGSYFWHGPWFLVDHIFSMGFKSGLCADQSATCTLVVWWLFLTQSDACFGLLSCSKMKSRRRPSCVSDCLRFYLKIFT